MAKFHLSEGLIFRISDILLAMDNNKARAVTEWPEPTTAKEMQKLLGFANFYRRFIRHFSTVAALLTSLPKGKPNTLKITPATRIAFVWLKELFTSMPVLK